MMPTASTRPRVGRELAARVARGTMLLERRVPNRREARALIEEARGWDDLTADLLRRRFDTDLRDAYEGLPSVPEPPADDCPMDDLVDLLHDGRAALRDRLAWLGDLLDGLDDLDTVDPEPARRPGAARLVRRVVVVGTHIDRVLAVRRVLDESSGLETVARVGATPDGGPGCWTRPGLGAGTLAVVVVDSEPDGSPAERRAHPASLVTLGFAAGALGGARVIAVADRRVPLPDAAGHVVRFDAAGSWRSQLLDLVSQLGGPPTRT